MSTTIGTETAALLAELEAGGPVKPEQLISLLKRWPAEAEEYAFQAEGKRCPECGSTEIVWDYPSDCDSSDATCTECGYGSRWMPDDTED